MLLTANRIVKKYKKSGRAVLNDINLRIEEKDFFVITGASGSGKSTFLAIIGGYLKPTEGEVLFCGSDLFSLKDKELSRWHNRKIGYIPQNNVMIKGYTVLENVMLPYQFGDHKKQMNDVKEKALASLNTLGIEDLYDRYPYELSGGEQKRVAFARALLFEPDFVIADEPTTGLDKKTADIIAKYLYDYSAKGKTVIAATHDDSVSSCGNRVLVLDNGTIVRDE